MKRVVARLPTKLMRCKDHLQLRFLFHTPNLNILALKNHIVQCYKIQISKMVEMVLKDKK